VVGVIMSDLILDSLEIENFKAFKRLTIDRLARVNLIVGKNNVGKTCLLEALWLYASRGNPEAIEEIVALRQEPVDDKDILASVRYLIYNREINNFENEPIQISSKNNKLKISKYFDKEKNIFYLSVSINNKEMFFFHKASGIFNLPETISSIPHLFVPTSRFTPRRAKELWSKIELTVSENYISQAWEIIQSQILHTSLQGKNNHKWFIEQLSGRNKFDFLSSLGEGVNHLFYFALAIVNVQYGFLLIDEIENGLHYSIQPQVWRFIFDMAQRLNVQVFATTHSWDCIEAFKEVTQEFPETEGLLISLWDVKDKPGEVVGVVADKEALNVITQSHIEVR
jgi:AAA15 family ATPase/GTPase